MNYFKSILTVSIITIIISLCFACSKKSSEPVILPSSFELVILNSKFEEASTFKQGEDVVFGFRIKNQTGSNLAWYDYAKTFDIDSLYCLFKLVNNNENKLNYYQYLGKPFSLPINTPDKPIILPPNSNDIYLKIPWSFNPSNRTLKAGDYKVAFNTSFIINGQKTLIFKYLKFFTIIP